MPPVESNGYCPYTDDSHCTICSVVRLNTAPWPGLVAMDLPIAVMFGSPSLVLPWVTLRAPIAIVANSLAIGRFMSQREVAFASRRGAGPGSPLATPAA